MTNKYKILTISLGRDSKVISQVSQRYSSARHLDMAGSDVVAAGRVASSLLNKHSNPVI